MNINLNFGDSDVNLEVKNNTSISDLYKMVNKIYNIPLQKIKLYDNSILMPNNSNFISDYFNQTHKINVIYDNDNTDIQNDNKEINYAFSDRKNSKTKSLFQKIKNIKLKKTYITCQKCNNQNAIYYCRNCNKFICFECNIGFLEHENHLKINLENGNLINSINYYKKEMINEVNIIEKSYNKSNHWIINDEIRNKYFDNLIGLINEIKLQQKELSNINNSHDINDTTFINLRKDLYNIQLPSFDEKIIDVFSEINKIEHLIDRYIFYVYRQVIKSNFNKNIMDIFEIIQKDLLKILNDGNKKIEEIKNLSNYSLKELKLYNEGEKVIEKNLKENKSSFPQIRLKTEQDKDYSNTFSKIKLTKHSYLRDLIIKEKLNLEKNINLRKRVKSEINENNNLCFTHGNNEIKMIPNKKSSRSTLVDINKIDRIFSMPVRNKKKK
jgi:hypothetical protein